MAYFFCVFFMFIPFIYMSISLFICLCHYFDVLDRWFYRNSSSKTHRGHLIVDLGTKICHRGRLINDLWRKTCHRWRSKVDLGLKLLTEGA